MTLSVGIVGLPNVGKSTLFNALLSKQQAFAANYPFATIEPNVGIVPVPDERLVVLAPIVGTTKLVPATVTFLDIAGLVKGASQGEGLGNKFLSHIREASVILHVVRAFSDSNVIQTGSGDSVEDYLTIETELQLADLSTLEKQKEPHGKVEKADTIRWSAVLKLRSALESGVSARSVDLLDEEFEAAKDLWLLTAKPQMFCLNTDEQVIQSSGNPVLQFIQKLQEHGITGIQENDVVMICAKLEEELAGFEGAERLEYLRSAGIARTGLETLIAAAYKRLGLMSFLTAGELEVRAWTIPVGCLAPDAAGVIHTDFIKHFISAKVCHYVDFVELGGWKAAAEKGKVRTEGKTYVMQEGDIVEFMIGK
ncbi:MAG: redox-regulated ATPase YchF [bacterium]